MKIDTLLVLTKYVIDAAMQKNMSEKDFEHIQELVTANDHISYGTTRIFYDINRAPVGVVIEYWLRGLLKNVVIKMKDFRDQTYEFEHGLTDLCEVIKNELRIYAYSNRIRSKEECAKNIEEIIHKYNANNPAVKLIAFIENDKIVEATIQGMEKFNREFTFKITIQKSWVLPETREPKPTETTETTETTESTPT